MAYLVAGRKNSEPDGGGPVPFATMLAVTIGREIGAKLAQLAKAKKLTQGQVAMKARLSQPTISALFNGAIQDPPIGTVVKVAGALEVSIDQLLGSEPIAAAAPPEGEAKVKQLEDDLGAVTRELRDLARRMQPLLDEREAGQVARPQRRSLRRRGPQG